MRLRLVLCALVALALSAPAAADVTLRYAPDSEGGRGLVIEADDAGRIRAETGPGQLLIMRDGDTYVVTPAEERPRVVRIDDFIAMAEEAARAFRRRLVNPTPSGTRYRLTDRGPQTVGAWPGTLLAIEQIGPHDPERDAQWVVSSDPAMVAPGRIALRVMEIQIRLADVMMGEEPPEFTARLHELHGRSAPLRIVGLYRLESLSADPVPASRFELPGPVMSREQLRQRLSR